VSSQTLQQLAVRLHHDPAFVAAVYANPELALAGEGLDARERDLLVAPDQRAWGADHQRRDRVLEALRAEFPVSCALAELATRGRDGLLAFFSAPAFHDCVRRWGVLALSFGEYLQVCGRDNRLGGRQIAETACLELAAARVRRSPARTVCEAPAALPEWLCRAPWIELVTVPSGSLTLLESVRSWLGSGGPARFPRLDPSAVETVLVERSEGAGDALAMGLLPGALSEVLERATQQVSADSLRSVLAAHGAGAVEADQALLALLEDRLLREAGS